MRDVTYTGPSDRRTISSAEWKGVGVSSRDVEWKSGETVQVADAAADFLARNQPHEFSVKGVDPKEETLRAAEKETVAGTGGEGGGAVPVGAGGTVADIGGATAGAGTTGTGTTGGTTAAT